MKNRKPARPKKTVRYKGTVPKQPAETGENVSRLNKFIANSGLCSRREADELIKTGQIKVNGKVVTAMGIKVGTADTVTHNSKKLSGERKVYLLLNKPKDCITTVTDTHGRRTVMELVGKACKERIYPVGRLDRNTTGLLLFTNDGDLAKKMTHPSYGVKKVYHVLLDKKLSESDMEKVNKGVVLDDGKALVDVISYIGSGENKKEVGVELHSGKNRVIRRIFDLLGYGVVKLDRILYGGLTKKDLPRGRWRFLNTRETGMLMMLANKKA
jgi:23S rRNA pseudouridine2605 synthase